jgi:hypothetical protein
MVDSRATLRADSDGLVSLADAWTKIRSKGWQHLSSRGDRRHSAGTGWSAHQRRGNARHGRLAASQAAAGLLSLRGRSGVSGAGGTADEDSAWREQGERWPYYCSSSGRQQAQHLAGQVGADLVIAPPVLLGPKSSLPLLRLRADSCAAGSLSFGAACISPMCGCRQALVARGPAGSTSIYHLPGIVCSLEDF